MNWRSQKGTYILFIEVSHHMKLRIGKLGVFDFAPGMYLYVGSAMGGFGKRIPRHLKQGKNNRWHIDYLLKHARVAGVLLLPSSQRLEEIVAEKLSHIEAVEPLVPGFGASDSRQATHLFRIVQKDEG